MPATVTINKAFLSNIERIMDARMGKMSADLRDAIRDELDTPYPPASNPGEPAHKRSGGLQAAVFFSRVRRGEFVVGFRRVRRDPDRPNSDRANLAIWMELGTGMFRQPFPQGASSVLKRTPTNTATTGSGGGMEPRPVLIPTLLRMRPQMAASLTRGGTLRLT